MRGVDQETEVNRQICQVKNKEKMNELLAHAATVRREG